MVPLLSLIIAQPSTKPLPSQSQLISVLLQEDRAPLLVRRKGKSLPADLQFGGEVCEKVDWCRSVLLNMVLQASYDLTVATCRWALKP